jgi:putative membrane protein
VEKVTAAYQSLQNSIDDMADKVSGIGNTKLNALLGNISGKLGETIATQTELKHPL